MLFLTPLGEQSLSRRYGPCGWAAARLRLPAREINASGFNLVDFYHNLSRLIGLDSNALSFEETGEIANELRAGFEAGMLHAPALETIPFENAVQAYGNVGRGKGRPKQVLTLSGN